MVVCVPSDFTPIQTIKKADELGWNYTLESYPKNSPNPTTVFFDVKSFGSAPPKKDLPFVMFFRGKDWCEFLVETWPFSGPKPALAKRDSLK